MSIHAVLHHATPNRFDVFDTSKEGAHFGTLEQAENLKKPGRLRIVTAEVTLSNPLRVPDLGTWTFNGVHAHLSREAFITDAEADEVWSRWQHSDADGWACLKQVLRRHGFDSFVYSNEQEGPGDSYVAFDASQIRILGVARPRH